MINMLYNGKRELAYTVVIDEIQPIEGSDNCECAVVGGWKVMVHKGEFKGGDMAVYFEIDAHVPEKEPFMFLSGKHFKIKTQKYTFGGKGLFLSQGLLMPLSEFDGSDNWVIGEPLTDALGVTYSVLEDNARKASSPDKFKKMAQRNPQLFKKPWAKWMMKRAWGRNVMFFFFGKKKDRRSWPMWVTKTDEERIQNMAHLIPELACKRWIATEKIDGTSTTFSLKKKLFGYDFYVCSRNVVMDKPNKDNFYKDILGTNVYWDMAIKYNVEKALKDMVKTWFKNKDIDFITLQGETYGPGIQKRDYSNKEIKFAGFNLIYGTKSGKVKRLNSLTMQSILEDYHIPTVPIVTESLRLPLTCDDILEYAEGVSEIDGLPREGIVFRSADGKLSFKAVSNSYLLKYH